MGLYTPAILGGNSYLSWFDDRGAIKDPAHTGTSKGLSQVINRGPIRKFQPKYADVYVTSQSHGLNAGVQTHCVTANGVRNRLRPAGVKKRAEWGTPPMFVGRITDTLFFLFFFIRDNPQSQTQPTVEEYTQNYFFFLTMVDSK